MESKSVIGKVPLQEDRYLGGVQSLTRGLKTAFAALLVIIVLMLIYFFTLGGYFSVEPQQAVLVLRFGRIMESFRSGGHWYLPYPVHRFVRIQTNPQFLNVDFTPAAVVGNAEDASLTAGRDHYLLTGDANIVHSNWKIAYHVSDPARYYETLSTPLKPVDNGRIAADEVETDAEGFTGTRGPQTFLTELFREAVIRVTASARCDEILTSGISAYRDAVSRSFAALVARENCGITVDDVTLNRIYPPSRTKSAFDEVTAAGNTGGMLRDQARAYRVETENDALAKEAEILAAAETYRKQAVARIKAESNYFQSIQKEYLASPETVVMALYTSALSEAMHSPGDDRFILGGGGKGRRQLRLLMNPELRTAPVAAPASESKEK